MVKRVMLACAALVLAGCDTIVEVVPNALPLDFTSSKVPYQASPAVNVGGGTAQVMVLGGLSTPCSGYQLTAEATDGNPITLRVTAARPDPSSGCLTVVEGFSYQAVVKNVSPGSHRVRVIHDVQGPNRSPETVADVTVQVQ